MNRKTAILTVAAFGILAAMVTWAVIRTQGTIQYRTATVQTGDINVTVSATGSPNAVVTVQVGSQVSGTIMALYADFNTKVKKGQLIARIDPEALQARVDQAQANSDAASSAVANAKAGVQKAKAGILAANAMTAAAVANVVKTQAAAKDANTKTAHRVELAKEGVISSEDLDTARTTSASAAADQHAALAQQHADEDNSSVAQADERVADTQLAANQSQLRQFAAALHSAQIDLDHTYIKAPVDGVVVSGNVDVGQTVAASLATPTLFQIAQDLTKMQVDTNVSEADVGRVRVGQIGTFTVDAYPAQVFKGEVTAIREAPINVQNVITYDVVIGVSNPDLKLFPGMTANVKIFVNQRSHVLKVLNAALRYHPAANATAQGRSGSATEKAVWLLNSDNQPRRIQVTTGESDGTFTEVSSDGLKDGDHVILASVAKASPASGGNKTGRGPGF